MDRHKNNMCSTNNSHQLLFARSLSSIHRRERKSSPISVRATSPFESNQLPRLPFSTDSQHSDSSPPERTAKPQRRLERRRSVSFAPLPRVDRKSTYTSLCQNYTLGDTPRSSSHMKTPQALHEVCALKDHDFVFLKRSDGSYSYAIIACRTTDDASEECMLFVVNESGSTKTVRKRNWLDYIRLLPTEVDSNDQVKIAVSEEIRPSGGMPEIVTFEQDCSDDCSLISNVSEAKY